MKAMWKFLLVAALGAGCASFEGGGRSSEEFILEAKSYRLWKEVFYLDGRTEIQWLLSCNTLSPARYTAKTTGIVLTESDMLYNCPTGTVLKCAIARQATKEWESVAKTEAVKLNLPDLRAKAAKLERYSKDLERTPGWRQAGASDVADARQAADEARNMLRQAELYAGAIVVKASDVIKFDVLREAPGIRQRERE